MHSFIQLDHITYLQCTYENSELTSLLVNIYMYIIHKNFLHNTQVNKHYNELTSFYAYKKLCNIN